MAQQREYYPAVVGSEDTVEGLTLELEVEAGIEFTSEAIGVLMYMSKAGIAPCVGLVNATIVTPRGLLGAEAPMPVFAFHDAALAKGMRALPLLAALRFVLRLPKDGTAVRCGTEPLTDGSGYDFVLVIDNTGDDTVVGADYSGLFHRDQMIDPDQKVLYRYEDPTAQ